MAFTAATNLGSGFKLFFSFDYAGNGPWAKADVINLINQYKSSPAYFRHGTKPLVSTFEGPKWAPDWVSIKSQTGCYFMPSYSSLGAKDAVATGVVDGLFSWAAWPNGPTSMFTNVDQSYKDFLSGKTYMMGVSPWFYTNMVGFRKNWLWRGDDLWHDRWQQVLYLQPEYVQIISWNDFGESHYIGPLRSTEYEAFHRGLAPFNYAINMPHDGWRLHLPFIIDLYKSGTATVSRESVVAWYRRNPGGTTCSSGGTTGNTATQLQDWYGPDLVSQDRIFYTALLGSGGATVTVSIGGVTQTGAWRHIPDGNVGIFQGSVPRNGGLGAVVVTVSRGGSVVAQMTGQPINTNCNVGITNWNAYVGSVSAANTIAAISPPRALSAQVCTAGTGPGNYVGLCNNACKYGYCPPVCTCTQMGKQVSLPAVTGTNGCPAAGLDITYLGLCQFNCNRGNCSPTACEVKPAGFVCNPPAAVAPPQRGCIRGTATGVFEGLCLYSCYLGYCPPEVCMCTQAADITTTSSPGISKPYYPLPEVGEDYGLCMFACNHDWCPENVCDWARDPEPTTVTVTITPTPTPPPAGTHRWKMFDFSRRTLVFSPIFNGNGIQTSFPSSPNYGWMTFFHPPDCSDANSDIETARNKFFSLDPFLDDASHGGMRCDGCDFGADNKFWDVEEFEIYDGADHPFTDQHLGHISQFAPLSIYFDTSTYGYLFLFSFFLKHQLHQFQHEIRDIEPCYVDIVSDLFQIALRPTTATNLRHFTVHWVSLDGTKSGTAGTCDRVDEDSAQHLNCLSLAGYLLQGGELFQCLTTFKILYGSDNQSE
jgi:hypothetical protein